MKKLIKGTIIFLLVIIVCLVILLIINNKKQDILDRENEEIITENQKYVTKQKYECNEFTISNVSLEDMLLMYFNSYKVSTYKNIEDAYNMLDEEYRNKRFGSIENYKTYIKEMHDEMESSQIVNYRVSEKNDKYTQYICTDNYGNYYIFREKAIMDYSIILDEYTVDMPEFLENYNKGNSIEKCAYNIQKCIEAINNKDYLYVYNKLEDTFRESNYKAQESFIKVIKDKLYKVNAVDEYTVSNEGDIYIFDIIIKDKNSSNKNVPMTIIMQLKEGTDFVMSFSFK